MSCSEAAGGKRAAEAHLSHSLGYGPFGEAGEARFAAAGLNTIGQAESSARGWLCSAGTRGKAAESVRVRSIRNHDTQIVPV